MNWVEKVEQNWKDQKVIVLILSILFIVPHINGEGAATSPFIPASWALAGLVVIFYQFMIRDEVSEKVNLIIKDTWRSKNDTAQETLNTISEELEKDVPNFDVLIQSTSELGVISEELKTLSKRFDIFTKVTKSSLYLIISGLLFLLSPFIRADLNLITDESLYIEAIAMILFLWGVFIAIEIFLIWYRLGIGKIDSTTLETPSD